jgi:hypothetical protein
MSALAFLFDDTPREWRQLPMCVFLPTLTVAVSWALIRWKKGLVLLAVGCAVTSAYIILHYFLHTLEGLESYQRYDRQYHWAVWFSATFPFVMILWFYFTTKKEPNQAPEPTR